MKTLKMFLVVTGVMLASLTFNSCLDDDGYSLGDMWYSVATAEPIDNSSFYLRLDGGTTLFPAAPPYVSYQPKQAQRVQVNYTILGDGWGQYDHPIKLNRLDTILTKQIAENLGVEKNDSIYGTDPIGIENIWVGDGYLNLIFKANFTPGVKNFVNLIPQDTTGESPYELEFRHHTYGGGTYSSYGIVAFDLSSLPDTEEQEVVLTIRIKTFEGEKVIEKKYNSKKNTDKDPTNLDVKSFENMLE